MTDTADDWSPVLPSVIFGRDDALHPIIELLLRPDVRVVTLLGTAGVGKTTVAALVAREWRGSTDGSVTYLDLTSAGQAQGPVGRGLGHVLPTVGGAPGGRGLVIVDQTEHAAPDEFDRLNLSAAADVTYLFVGQRSLNVGEEHRVVLPPLAIPPSPDDAVVSANGRVDSMMMFDELVTRVSPDFDRAAHHSTVAAICAHLDGLPLALEIAAFQLRVMTVAELLATIEAGRVGELRGPVSLAHRHQTLSAAFRPAFDSLGQAARRALHTLARFTGSFTLASAEWMLARVADDLATQARGDPTTVETPIDTATIDMLAELVDCNLVVAAQHGDHTSYRAPRVVSDIVRRADRDTAIGAIAERAHAELIIARVRRGRDMAGRDAERWLDDIAADIGDVRSALAFLIDSSDRGAQDVAAGLRPYWLQQGLLLEGLAWIEQSLAIGPAIDDALRAHALEAHALLTAVSSSYANALGELQHACDLRRALGDEHALGRILVDYAGALVEVHGFLTAEPVFIEAIVLLERAGDRWSAARARTLLGAAAAALPERRDFAEGTLRTAVDEFRALGDVSNTNVPLQQIGRMLHVEGHDDQAIALLNEGLLLVTGNGDAWNASVFLNLLAEIDLDNGKAVSAGRRYLDSLTLAVEIGIKPRWIWCLEGLAASLAAEGERVYAARVVTVATALRLELNLASWVEFPARLIDLSSVYSALSPTEFESARGEGYRTSVQDILVRVPVILDEIAARAALDFPKSGRRRFPDGLTRREVDVLRLIAMGRTSRAIASELFISIETVGRHISNLYRKIDARGRADATAYALRMELAE